MSNQSAAVDVHSKLTYFFHLKPTHPSSVGNAGLVRQSDLPPVNRASRSLVKFVLGEEDEHEE
ncbi:hypothetical protein, partial [Burkholderia cepacia]